MASITVLGLDPSLANFGIARVVVDIDERKIIEVLSLEVVETEKTTCKVVRRNSDDITRAQALHAAMQQAAVGCHIAFAEVPVGSQSARAMASYGICIGVLAACPIPLIEVTPIELKLAVIGKKTASKEEIIAKMVGMYPHEDWYVRKVKGVQALTAKNEHIADALGAVVAGLGTSQFQQVMSIFSHVRSSDQQVGAQLGRHRELV